MQSLSSRGGTCILETHIVRCHASLPMSNSLLFQSPTIKQEEEAGGMKFKGETQS